MFALRHPFAQHYTNISLIKYIYISYETCAFIFTWATLQTRQVRLASQLLGTVWTDWRSSHCTCCTSTCVEYGSIKSWQLKRKEGCEMVGGYIPPVLHSFLYNFKVLKVKQKEKIKLISGSMLRGAPQFLIWVTLGLFAGQVITCCGDVGCNNKSTVISSLDIICICTISLIFCPNSYSGLSYSLNTGSLKAENSLNWLV